MSANITRRHLTASQRAFIAGAPEVWDLYEVGQGRRSDLAPNRDEVGGRTDEKLAAMFSVGKNAVQQAHALWERDPEVAAAGKAGLVNLTEAYEAMRSREQPGVRSTPAPPRLLTQLPPAAIHANTWSPYRQASRESKATRELIEKRGIVEPVIVREHPSLPGEYEAISGEHQVAIALELEMDTVPAVVIEADDVEAKKLTIVVNETRGHADLALLAEVLAELPDDDLAGLPFSPYELEHLRELGATDWEQYIRPEPGELPQGPETFWIKLMPDAMKRLNDALDVIRDDRGLDGDEAILFAVEHVAAVEGWADEGRESC